MSYRWKLDVPFMTKPEQLEFRRMVDMGQISFFRTRACDLPGCGAQIPTVKQYCSRTHMEEDERRKEEEHRAQLKQAIIAELEQILPRKGKWR